MERGGERLGEGRKGEEWHKVVVEDMAWRVKQQTRRNTNVDAIKWSKMRSKEKEPRERLVSKMNWNVEGEVEAVWGSVAEEVRKICREVLGVSRGGKTMINKDTWWWDESGVQSAFGAIGVEREEESL